MNADPHIHEPKVEQRYAIINAGEWILRYGDQTTRICMEHRVPTLWAMKRALKRAIRRHARHSHKAGRREKAKQFSQLNPEYIQRLTDKAWGKR